MLGSFPKVPNTQRPKARKTDFRLPHCCMTPPFQGNPANIRINLILSESRVIGLHRRHWEYSLSSFKFSWWAQKDARVFETWCVMALQGRPRSLILAPIESAYVTSYWSSIVTLVLSCPVSEILQVSGEERPHPYSTRIFGVFIPLD